MSTFGWRKLLIAGLTIVGCLVAVALGQYSPMVAGMVIAGQVIVAAVYLVTQGKIDLAEASGPVGDILQSVEQTVGNLLAPVLAKLAVTPVATPTLPAPVSPAMTIADVAGLAHAAIDQALAQAGRPADPTLSPAPSQPVSIPAPQVTVQVG
jgi:hypothetical protein